MHKEDNSFEYDINSHNQQIMLQKLEPKYIDDSQVPEQEPENLKEKIRFLTFKYWENYKETRMKINNQAIYYFSYLLQLLNKETQFRDYKKLYNNIYDSTGLFDPH